MDTNLPQGFAQVDVINKRNINLKGNLIGRGCGSCTYKAISGYFGITAVRITFYHYSKETERELEHLIKLTHHPNTVRIFAIVADDYDVKQGYAMEYMENGSLDKVIHTKCSQTFLHSYGSSQTIRWMTQSIRALIYLHDAGIRHRDVRPQNMFLCDNFEILKLGQIAQPKPYGFTTYGIGSPLYTAPEVALIPAKGGEYSTNSDIFALGICLWELATRQKPFDDNFVPYYSNVRPKLEEVDVDAFRLILPLMWHENPQERLSAAELLDYFLECEQIIKEPSSLACSIGQVEIRQQFLESLYGTWIQVPEGHKAKVDKHYKTNLTLIFERAQSKQVSKYTIIRENRETLVEDLQMDGQWHKAPRGCSQRLTMLDNSSFRWEFGKPGKVYEEAQWLIFGENIKQSIYYSDRIVRCFFKKMHK